VQRCLSRFAQEKTQSESFAETSIAGIDGIGDEIRTSSKMPEARYSLQQTFSHCEIFGRFVQ
jgi:hypothetical protein